MEYFIVAQTRPAPLISDEITAYETAHTPADALTYYVEEHSFPIGIWSAKAWRSADDYHKKQPPLAEWQAYELQRYTASRRAEEFPLGGCVVETVGGPAK
jgi:hypothetical protein